MTQFNSVLALAPQFPLASNWEDNILRCFSGVDPLMYLKTTETKEEEMRDRLVSLTTGTRLIRGPFKLPSPSPDIDLLVEDLDAGILIIAELKWSRKPGPSPHERKHRDQEVLKGVSQIGSIRKFIESNPRYLYDRGSVTRFLSSYRDVCYCVIARDHLVESPNSECPIFSYDAFNLQLVAHKDTSAVLRSLSNMEWLPEEGVDFSVDFQGHQVESVAVELETYFPPQGPLPFIL